MFLPLCVHWPGYDIILFILSLIDGGIHKQSYAILIHEDLNYSVLVAGCLSHPVVENFFTFWHFA